MFQKYKLKNALRVITVPLKNTKTVTVLVMVETGSKYESKATNGIAHFLEHMFFKGTKRRPSTLDLALEIDRIGGEQNAFTSKEFTGYYAKAGAKHEALLLDLIADMYLHSKLAPSEIEREKGVICEEINLRQDTPVVYVSDLFEKLLYGEQPAGWLTIGSKENVQSWTRGDIVNYLKQHYVALNTIVLVVGQIEPKKTLDQVKKYFNAASKAKPPTKKKVEEVQNKPQILLHSKSTDQTHFCLGIRGYSVKHPDYFTLKVLNTILGEGMSSRLFISVRERRGLAYYIKTDLGSYTDSGYLVAQAGVPNDKFSEAIKIILSEFSKVKDKEVPLPELSKSKEHLKGSLLLNLETGDEIAFWLAGQEVIRKEILTQEEIFKKIDAVKAKDIQRVAQDIFQNKNLNLAVIGPHQDQTKIDQILKF